MKHELNEQLRIAAALLPLASGARGGVGGESPDDVQASTTEKPLTADALQTLQLVEGRRPPHPASPLRGAGQEAAPAAPHPNPLPKEEETRNVKLVANLPYNIASPLVIELLIAGVQTLAFTVQKEVADRLAAKAGDDAYGSISVMVQLLGDVEVMRTLPPQAFWPAPKIDSALVRVRRRDRLGPQANTFSRFLHQLFSARRKTLRKALAQADYQADTIIAALSLDPQARPETLDPQTLWAVFQQTC